MKFTTKLRIAGAAAFITTGILTHTAYAQEETIKVGVLHSLSGTMAISVFWASSLRPS